MDGLSLVSFSEQLEAEQRRKDVNVLLLMGAASGLFWISVWPFMFPKADWGRYAMVLGTICELVLYYFSKQLTPKFVLNMYRSVSFLFLFFVCFLDLQMSWSLNNLFYSVLLLLTYPIIGYVNFCESYTPGFASFVSFAYNLYQLKGSKVSFAYYLYQLNVCGKKVADF